jgi:acetyl-CoA C-acetyltransferase
MRIAIVACGLTQFGVRSATFRELAAEAGKTVLDDAENLDRSEIDALFVGTALPERFVHQGYTSPLVAEQLGLEPRIISRCELACASGQAAMRAAYSSLASHMCEVALVMGIEKMNSDSPEKVQHTLASILDTEWDAVHGLSAPSFFAMCAQRHILEYGTTREQMAMVSKKNHGYAMTNQYAQFKKEVTVEEVLNSRVISPPLTLLECSAVTDGAAAVLMTTEERAKTMTDTPVYIVGHGQKCAGNLTGNLHSLSGWASLRQAAGQAYRSAGITPQDIDLAEIHDCFSISEIMEYEGLEFCVSGEGGKFIEEGRSYVGGDVAVNTRGGLLGVGHPLGATGVAQAIEIVNQIKGRVPKSRYVKDIKYALSHNLSGNGSVHSVLIYGRD